ncbi:MAG: putative zinc-binding protein [Acidobacteriia bacterium]|nr:putative zinc-binding protein [Terriglobia bacterium]
MKKERVLIVPCSGIGKTFGTVTREGAYVVTEDLCPNETKLVPLALLVLGEDEARATLSGARAIAIDGCKLACAAKVVGELGGTVAHSVQVVDVFRRHRELKPSGIAELDENGRKLAHALAEEVKRLVASMTEGTTHA